MYRGVYMTYDDDAFPRKTSLVKAQQIPAESTDIIKRSELDYSAV